MQIVTRDKEMEMLPEKQAKMMKKKKRYKMSFKNDVNIFQKCLHKKY